MELGSKFEEIDRIVNKLKFDLLKRQLFDLEITTPDTLKMVTRLIYDNAILDHTLCSLYAQLCSDLIPKLPSFPSDKPYEKETRFKRLLVNKCQETFESVEALREEIPVIIASYSVLERMIKLQTRGNICFLGELFKQNILTEGIAHKIIKKLLERDNNHGSWDEGKVDAVCHFLNIVGKKLDGNSNSGCQIDVYFDSLKKISTNQQLSPYRRSMVLDVIHLRSNNWVPM